MQTIIVHWDNAMSLVSVSKNFFYLTMFYFCRIANSLPSFTSLTSGDQVVLLKENADLIVSLRGAIFFDKKKKGMDQILSSIGISTSYVEYSLQYMDSPSSTQLSPMW